MNGALRVGAGAVVLLRLFDVAYGVDLGLAESPWLRNAGSPGSRRQLSTAPAKSLVFGVCVCLVASLLEGSVSRLGHDSMSYPAKSNA